jgi:hypothetical protein
MRHVYQKPPFLFIFPFQALLRDCRDQLILVRRRDIWVGNERAFESTSRDQLLIDLHVGEEVEQASGLRTPEVSTCEGVTASFSVIPCAGGNTRLGIVERSGAS